MPSTTATSPWGSIPAAAVAELERLLAIEPGSARLWTFLGRNQILLGGSTTPVPRSSGRRA